MLRLSSADQRHLDAALAHLDANEPLVAAAELILVSAGGRQTRAFLAVRWRLEAVAGKWERCLSLARTLVRLAPAMPVYRLFLARSLTETNAPKRARIVLDRAMADYPEEMRMELERDVMRSAVRRANWPPNGKRKAARSK